MIAASQTDGVSIGRLRVRLDAADFDPMAARLELERLLGALDWSVPWLSPSAVLCIKQLLDPRPGALRLKSGELRPAEVWRRALLGAMEDKVRRAVRPAFGAAPADAEAVVFADRGELIACLALDWCNGRVASRWWWSALFGAGALDRATIVSLLETPEYVPPVLDRLARARLSAEFSARVSRQDVERLLVAVVGRFGLEHLAAASLPEHRFGVPADDPRDAEEVVVRHQRGVPVLPSAAGVPSTIAPWNAWIEQHEVELLDSTALQLFGIALSLLRAPTAVRTAEFAQALERHWVARAAVPERHASPTLRRTPASTTPTTGSPSQPAHALPHHAQPPAPTAVKESGSAAATVPSRAAPPGAASREPRADRSLASQSPQDATDEAAPIVVEPAIATVAAVSAAAARDVPGAIDGEASTEARFALQSAPATAPPAWDEGQRLARMYGAAVETGLGGLFYLANVALALGFYPDFTRPRERGLSLSIWDFIALTGERLLARSLDDPVWALLARLAGRGEHERPGASFSPPADGRLPCDWSSVLNTPGVSVAPATPSETFEPFQAPAASLERWLDWLVPHVQARLSLALGSTSPEELCSELLIHSARVHVSDTHVDVRLALAELPVAVRRAGLDRDPGWLPAAGRFLSFHFD
jgi:hypothetical protein